MKKKNISISLEGEHMARNIAMLVQKASKYESSIYIQSGAVSSSAPSAETSSVSLKSIPRVIMPMMLFAFTLLSPD